jgi:hypothetical protein
MDKKTIKYFGNFSLFFIGINSKWGKTLKIDLDQKFSKKKWLKFVVKIVKWIDHLY